MGEPACFVQTPKVKKKNSKVGQEFSLMPLGQIIKVHMHISEVSLIDGFPYELNRRVYKCRQRMNFSERKHCPHKKGQL